MGGCAAGAGRGGSRLRAGMGSFQADAGNPFDQPVGGIPGHPPRASGPALLRWVDMLVEGGRRWLKLTQEG